MKSTLLILLLVAQSIIIFGQSKLTEKDYNSSGAFKLIYATEIKEAQTLAQYDIDTEMPFLLLQSGIAPIEYSTDKTFEKRFKINYFEQGCTGPEYELMKAYNLVVLEHLDNAYGEKWYKSVRKDVIGFEEWKDKELHQQK